MGSVQGELEVVGVVVLEHDGLLVLRSTSLVDGLVPGVQGINAVGGAHVLEVLGVEESGSLVVVAELEEERRARDLLGVGGGTVLGESSLDLSLEVVVLVSGAEGNLSEGGASHEGGAKDSSGGAHIDCCLVIFAENVNMFFLFYDACSKPAAVPSTVKMNDSVSVKERM